MSGSPIEEIEIEMDRDDTGYVSLTVCITVNGETLMPIFVGLEPGEDHSFLTVRPTQSWLATKE